MLPVTHTTGYLIANNQQCHQLVLADRAVPIQLVHQYALLLQDRFGHHNQVQNLVTVSG